MRKDSKLFAFFAVAILLLCLATGGRAQSDQGRGRITGVVTDAAGAAVAGAAVSLVDASGAVAGVAESNAEGRYVIENVAAGSYALRVTKPTFADARRAVTVTAGETAADVRLEVGELAAEVTVTAEAGNVADTRQIDQQVNVVPENRVIERATEVIAQVADEEPGVNLQRTSPSLGGIFVRGLTGRNVAVYLDGARFTTSAQRGGINTFLNLNEATNLESVEIVRGAATSQYGSDALGGVVHFIPQRPVFGDRDGEFHGNANLFFTSASAGFGGNTLLTYGTERYGLLANIYARRINTLRPGGGFDTHSALTRFLGIRSDIFGERLPDTAFTQYGSLLRANLALTDTSQLIFSYTRSQQDGGRRYDQLLGGDGNLRADLRNLMLDFFVARLTKQNLGFFDNGSFTFSYNGQREERTNQGGQGNPLAAVTSQRERTNVFGFNFFVDKQFNERHTTTLGAEVYRDRINTYSLTFEPAASVTTFTRPRVPNGARYLSYGLFAQHVAEVIPNRLRLSGALRYSVASYRARAADAALDARTGLPVNPDDSERFGAFSGRVGAVFNVGGGFDIAAKYARGFRAPNTTDLGTVGLVGNGFEVNAQAAAARGGLVGTTAGRNAESSGVAVGRLEPERSDNFDLSLRFRRSRFDFELTGFTNRINGVFAEQALILPPGAVGTFLGDQQITGQDSNGVVFVPVATNPVLVRVNFGDVRFNGVEFETEARLTKELMAGGNFTYVRGEDVATGLPPNVEGGVPPASGFVSLRYEPPGRRFYVEAYSILAARQTRLSSLDIEDRRTGATRTRAQIANFFNRGARVRGLIGAGVDDRTGTADDVLIPTGETVAQVQNRVLGVGVNSAPLYTAVPGYGLVGLRGALRFGENSELFVDFENIADKNYRGISWGVDGPGRSVTLRYRYRF